MSTIAAIYAVNDCPIDTGIGDNFARSLSAPMRSLLAVALEVLDRLDAVDDHVLSAQLVMGMPIIEVLDRGTIVAALGDGPRDAGRPLGPNRVMIIAAIGDEIIAVPARRTPLSKGGCA